MSTPATDMAEKHARILGELAGFGLNLARKLHDQGMAAETSEETAELARAFHSVARSVRQTLALEARLLRDGQRQAREDRAEAERIRRRPAEARKTRIGNALERLVWSEHEGDEDEAERLFDDIYERLTADAEAADFLDHAIDDQIGRLCAEFGLPPPARPVVAPPIAPPISPAWPPPPAPA